MISFEKLSYVRRTVDGRYQLSVKALQLGRSFENSIDQRELIETTLKQLRDSTGESVYFYVRDGDNRVCLMGEDSPQSLRVYRKIGVLIPMDSTSISEVLRTYEGGAPAGGYEPASLARHSIGAYDPLTSSVSAPVFDRKSALIGVIAVSGPVGRFDAGNPETLEHIGSAAGRLSRLLGFLPPAG